MPGTLKRVLITTMTILMLTVSTSGFSSTVEEEPSALAMAGDALIARPALAVMTIAGSAIYTVTLPFSLLGGNASEAGETLVVGPSKSLFVRCLGCTTPGRKAAPVVAGEENDSD